MGTAITIFVIAAVLVALVFVLLWLRDARRSDSEQTDPERLQQAPTTRQGSTHHREGE